MNISKEQADSWADERLGIGPTYSVERQLKITLPWKSKVWNSLIDIIEYRRQVLFIAWKKMPCKFGYKIRIGII